MKQVLPGKNIAVFGGAFDPPHLGHATVISNILDSNLADEVWIVPVGDDRIDKPTRTPGPIRARMVEAMIAEVFAVDAPLKLDTVQLDGKLPGSYTIDLLDHFEARHPDLRFSFVIGQDNVVQLSSWRRWPGLCKRARFLVVPRPGSDPEAPPPEGVSLVYVRGHISDASSSSVRALVRSGQPLDGVVPLSVARIIRDSGLYRA